MVSALQHMGQLLGSPVRAPRWPCVSPAASVQSPTRPPPGWYSRPSESLVLTQQGPGIIHRTAPSPRRVILTLCGSGGSTKQAQGRRQCLAQPQQGADARIDLTLLDVDDHPSAHRRRLGQVVQRQPRAWRSDFTRAPITAASAGASLSMSCNIMHLQCINKRALAMDGLVG